MPESLRRLWSRDGVRAALLAVCTFAVYAGSLPGEFLNYDDDWLILENDVLDLPLSQALPTILFDFSHRTRMELGAEYLPVRDLSVWLDVALFGRSAPAMRTVQLLLWVLAALAFRASFVLSFGPLRGELLAWAFALHPLHLESVAWLAGRKDVLALLMMGACLWRHARDGRDARFSVPLLWALASLSKSMSVGLLGPLIAIDLCRPREHGAPPAVDLPRYLLGFALVGLSLLAHLHVGSVVQMVSGPLAGKPDAAFWTMGEVWLRYLRMVLDPSVHSVRHDALFIDGPTPGSLLGWTLLLAALGWALARLRRGDAVAAAGWLWFAVPLAPVTHIILPLQNVYADRYLWLSVAGPLLLLCHADRLLRPRLATALVAGCIALWAGSTALRAPRFASSEALFREATARTQGDATAPHHVGLALSRRGEPARAQPWFEKALARADTRDAVYPKIVHSLARSLALQGALPRALAIVERGLGTHPDHGTLREDAASLRAEMARQLDAQGGTLTPP